MFRRNLLLMVFACLLVICSSRAAYTQQELEGFDALVFKWTTSCKNEIQNQFEKMLSGKKLTENQLFDTFYNPMPGTYPQKYHSQSDVLVEQEIQPILDKYLAKNKRLVFVKLVDKNGYTPVHNKKFSESLAATGDAALQKYRTKRIFNDAAGMKAAQNQNNYLLQRYNRDTGEVLNDMSVPIMVRGKHWGAVRIGYKVK